MALLTAGNATSILNVILYSYKFLQIFILRKFAQGGKMRKNKSARTKDFECLENELALGARKYTRENIKISG